MENTRIFEILRLIDKNGQNVAVRLAEQDGVSRQTASTWLSRLKASGLIMAEGKGRGLYYSLKILERASRIYPREGLAEDQVWRELCLPVVKDLPENVRGIWHHGMTEMINNAVDHSGSETVKVIVVRNGLLTRGMVIDQGEGIFHKIQRAMNLYDPREALLELAKGKFTTDPAHHSGEGIFFSSKMFDGFSILSRGLHFFHDGDDPDYLFELPKDEQGTFVSMRLVNDSERTTKEVFDRFALPEDFSFAKTIVPVKLAQHEGEKLVSRSQAKRLTRRFERFQTVILDFKGVEEIGQGFADEVFRVFQSAHPDLKMTPTNMSDAVRAMIRRVKNPS